MILDNLSSRDVIFSLDIGTRSIKGTVGIVRDTKFHVIAEHLLEHQERAMVDGQIHDITLVSKTVLKIKNTLEEKLNFKLTDVAIAAAGRFLRTVESKAEIELEEKAIDNEIIKSLELSAVKDAEEKINKSTDGKLYCVGYSVKNYYLNGYIISNLLSHMGEKASIEVIATFLPRSVVDSLYAVMNKVGLRVINMTLEPIAAMEAAVPQNLRLLNIALIDIGAGTSDIAICNKESISAYGMVPLAGDEVTEAIAQAYLVDFNSAEKMKRELAVKEFVSYTDVIGFENTVKSEEISNLVEPVVEKICNEISSKILELNGQKPPSAIFLVGGGAHTPYLKEKICKNLNLPLQRIGIKERDAVVDVQGSDLNWGSTGVTVLGIALVSIKSLGQDFINVFLNGNVISLFNSHKHNIMDVLLHGNINPKVLIGKNGKNIRFELNGNKRLSFGEVGKNAEIKINGEIASLDTNISDEDVIEVSYAINGVDAAPRVIEFINSSEEVSFYFDDKLIVLEPVVYINGLEAQIDSVIKNEDNVEIYYPKSLSEIRKYVLKLEADKILKVNKVEVNDDYIVRNGDIITTELYNNDIKEDIGIDEGTPDGVDVIVNGKSCTLKGKKSFVFVDVFNFVEFDLTVAKGKINLLLNGLEAAYTDILKSGDRIEIFWS